MILQSYRMMLKQSMARHITRSVQKKGRLAAMLCALVLSCQSAGAETRVLTLEEALEKAVLTTLPVQEGRLEYENSLLEYENYRKQYLPSLSLDISPFSFNHAMRILQDANTGAYSNVDNYSGQMGGGLSVRQKIGLTGGTVSMSSTLSYIREFSRSNNSFSTSPFHFSYSQSLLGGYRRYRYEREKNELERQLAVKTYCSVISSERQKILTLYMDAYVDMLDRDLFTRNITIGDSVMLHARLKKMSGKITDYEYKQLELDLLNNRMMLQKAQMRYEQDIRKLSEEIGMEDICPVMPNYDQLPGRLEYADVHSLATSNNPRLLNDRLGRLNAEDRLAETLLNTGFNTDISVSYGLNQYANSFVPAYQRPSAQQSVSVTLKIPVFQWGINRNKRRIARNTYEQSELSRQQSERDFEDEIRDCILVYNHHTGMLSVACEKYALTQELHVQAARKFCVGKLSAIELSDTAKDCLESKNEMVEAMQEVLEKYHQLCGYALYDFSRERSFEEIYGREQD